MSNQDKFIQPLDGIEVTEQSTTGTPFYMQELLELGRERVAAGEDPDEVALDLAQWQVAIEENQKD